MSEHVILLVEDNSSDEELTLRALKKSNVLNRVVVVRTVRPPSTTLFARGAHAGRDPNELPQVVLLDLNLPKISGLDVLRAIRADERTKWIPVVILTSSNEDRDLPWRLLFGRKQLHRQARRLHAVRRGGTATGGLLARPEPASAALGLR